MVVVADLIGDLVKAVVFVTVGSVCAVVVVVIVIE